MIATSLQAKGSDQSERSEGDWEGGMSQSGSRPDAAPKEIGRLGTRHISDRYNMVIGKGAARRRMRGCGHCRVDPRREERVSALVLRPAELLEFDDPGP
jgi:hypothetical protein